MLRCQTNGDHDTFEVRGYLVIGEPEHAISAGYKPFVATLVVTNTFFEIVAFAIDLNDQLAGMRDKVRNVTAHWNLPAEAEPGEPICLQVTPQQSFGARHRAP